MPSARSLVFASQARTPLGVHLVANDMQLPSSFTRVAPDLKSSVEHWISVVDVEAVAGTPARFQHGSSLCSIAYVLPSVSASIDRLNFPVSSRLSAIAHEISGNFN